MQLEGKGENKWWDSLREIRIERSGRVNTENKVKFEVASCKEIGDSRGVYLETRASEP